MSAVDTKFYEKKKSSTFYGSLVFLFIIIASSVGLYIYSNNIAQANSDMSATISQIDSSISQLWEDSSVQIYSIYTQNKVFLEELSERSNIPWHIAHLRRSLAASKISALWYSYSEWVAKMELSAQTDDDDYAYKKIVNFLESYRSDEKAIFEIESVSNFKGYDKMTFSAEFTLK